MDIKLLPPQTRCLVEAVVKGLVMPGKALNKLKSNPALIASLTAYIITDI